MCQAASTEFTSMQLGADGTWERIVPCTCYRTKRITINNIHYMSKTDRRKYKKTMPKHMQPKNLEDDPKTRHKSYVIDCIPEDAAFHTHMGELGLDANECLETYHPFYNSLKYVSQEDANEAYPESNMDEILMQYNTARATGDDHAVSWKDFQTENKQAAGDALDAAALVSRMRKQRSTAVADTVPLSAHQISCVENQQPVCEQDAVLLPQQHVLGSTRNTADASPAASTSTFSDGPEDSQTRKRPNKKHRSR